MQQGADAEPEETCFIECHVARYGAGVATHATTMAERITVLRFDRLAPLLHHLEKAVLESLELPDDVADRAASVGFLEEPMRRRERMQCSSTLSTARPAFCQLSQRFGSQHEITELHGQRLRQVEILLGVAQFVGFRGNYAEQL